MLSSGDIPVIVKHTALAIFLNSRGLGAGKKKILASLSIARAALTRSGYLVKGSDQKGLTGRIALTPKGRRRDKEHTTGKDTGARAKSAAFDALVDYVSGVSKDYRAALLRAKKAKKFSGRQTRAKPTAKRKHRPSVKKTKKRKSRTVAVRKAKVRKVRRAKRKRR